MCGIYKTIEFQLEQSLCLADCAKLNLTVNLVLPILREKNVRFPNIVRMKCYQQGMNLALVFLQIGALGTVSVYMSINKH